MKAKKFPDEVYVQWQEDDREVYLNLSESPEDAARADIDKAEPVAVYTLNRVVRMVRTVKITESPVAAAEGE